MSSRMMLKKELLLIFFLVIGKVISQNLKYCYANNKNPNTKFGTRTAYRFIRGGKTPYDKVPNCKPVQIWMIIRHGTKYPSPESVVRLSHLSTIRDEIIFNHRVKGHGKLCEADIKNLNDWSLDSHTNLKGARLSEEGVDEMNGLGKRTRANFPELFPPVVNDVNSKNYKFRMSSGERASSSLREFMMGLLDRVNISYVGPPDSDPQLESIKNCSEWVSEVANNQKHLIEVEKFIQSLEYQKLILNVSRRLGFSYNISPDWIFDIWDMCRYDTAWNIRKLSPWCAVFADEELKILEYQEDLVDYYKRSYGHELNIRSGLPLMRNLFWHFQKLESDNYSNEPKGVFNVGRSGNLHLFLAAMGFAKDSKPLLASDFSSRMEYKWKTSEIGSFAANLAAVFYKCNDTRSSNKVKFYMAEKPVHYDGCQSELCDWEYLKNKLFLHSEFKCNSILCYPNTEIWFLTILTVINFLALISIIAVINCRRRRPVQILYFPFWLWLKFSKLLRLNDTSKYRACNYFNSIEEMKI